MDLVECYVKFEGNILSFKLRKNYGYYTWYSGALGAFMCEIQNPDPVQTMGKVNENLGNVWNDKLSSTYFYDL